jgi:ankyrin repeat protein
MHKVGGSLQACLNDLNFDFKTTTIEEMKLALAKLSSKSASYKNAITIQNGNLDQSNLRELLILIEKIGWIREFIFSQMHINQDALPLLSRFLSSSQVTGISFNGSILCEMMTPHLETITTSNKGLSHFSMATNNPNPHENRHVYSQGLVVPLISQVSRCCSLVRLHLSFPVDNSGLELLAKDIKSKNTLQELSLGSAQNHLRIGSAGVALGDMLRKVTSLTTFHLGPMTWENDETNIGAVFDGLRENRSIKKLTLHEINYPFYQHPQVVKKLAEAFKASKSLLEVSLGMFSGDPSADIVFAGLAENVSIVSFGMYRTRMTQTSPGVSMSVIASVLKVNTTLTALNVFPAITNIQDQQPWLVLLEALKVNRTLRSLKNIRYDLIKDGNLKAQIQELFLRNNQAKPTVQATRTTKIIPGIDDMLSPSFNLLEQVDTEEEKTTVLHEVVRRGSENQVKTVLLRLKALAQSTPDGKKLIQSPSFWRNKAGKTPFQIAKERIGMQGILPLLIPIHLAAKENNRSDVSIWLRLGFDPNEVDLDGNTALHVVTKFTQNREVLRLLLENGGNLNIADSSFHTPVETITDLNLHLDLIGFLICQRGLIGEESVQFFLREAYSRCKGTFGAQSVDREVINQQVSRLTGYDVSKLVAENNYVYFGHLNSLAGSVTHHQRTQSYEGFFVDRFLPLRIRSIFELLVRISRGEYGARLPLSADLLVPLLIKELLVQLETLRCHKDLEFIETRFSGDVRKKLLANLADNQREKISALQEKDSLCIATGFIGHAIYVCFDRRGSEVRVRVDNLGRGVNSWHTGADKAGEYYPYAMSTNRLGSNISQYVVNVLEANKLGELVACDLIYDKSNVLGKVLLSKSELVQSYKAKAGQLVGNCVVKGHEIGLKFRLGDEQVYRWFREEEVRVIPFKYLSEAVAFFGSSATRQKACADSGVSEPELAQIFQSVIDEAKEQQGFADIHFAVIKNDVDTVNKLLLENAKLAGLKTKEGVTPLHLACIEAHPQMIQTLLSYVPNRDELLEAKTESGNTPMSLCVEMGTTSSMSIARCLKEQGAKSPPAVTQTELLAEGQAKTLIESKPLAGAVATPFVEIFLKQQHEISRLQEENERLKQENQRLRSLQFNDGRQH